MAIREDFMLNLSLKLFRPAGKPRLTTPGARDSHNLDRNQAGQSDNCIYPYHEMQERSQNATERQHGHPQPSLEDL